MKRIALAGVAAALVVLSACGAAGPKDFRKDAEKFLRNSREVETEVGQDVVEAMCEAPASVTKGETFDCSAVLADGTTVIFVGTVTGDRNYVMMPFADMVDDGTTPSQTAPTVDT